MLVNINCRAMIVGVLISFFFYCSVVSSLSLSVPASPFIPSLKSSGETVTYYTEISVPTLHGIHLTDLTPFIRTAIATSGVTNGQVNIVSKHTTTAITINEMEVQ